MAMLNLVFAALLVAIYAFSFYGVGWAVASWFVEPPGRVWMRFGARPLGPRFLKFLLLAILLFFVAGYVFFNIIADRNLSTINAFFSVLLLGLLINSIIVTLIPPAVNLGMDGLRAGKMVVPWDQVFHWEESSDGILLYRRAAKGQLTRIDLPVRGEARAKAVRLLEQRAPLIPADKPARDCLACGHHNAPEAVKCESCKTQLVDRVALHQRARQIQGRNRTMRVGCFLFFLFGFFGMYLLSMLLG